MLVLIANKKKVNRRKLLKDVNLESKKKMVIWVTQYLQRRKKKKQNSRLNKIFQLELKQ